MRVIPKAFVDISPSPHSVQQQWPDKTSVEAKFTAAGQKSNDYKVIK